MGFDLGFGALYPRFLFADSGEVTAVRDFRASESEALKSLCAPPVNLKPDKAQNDALTTSARKTLSLDFEA